MLKYYDIGWNSLANRNSEHYRVTEYDMPEKTKTRKARFVEGWMEPWLADKVYKSFVKSTKYETCGKDDSHGFFCMSTNSVIKRQEGRKEATSSSLDKYGKMMLQAMNTDKNTLYDSISINYFYKNYEPVSFMLRGRSISSSVVTLGPPTNFLLTRNFDTKYKYPVHEIKMCHGDSCTVVEDELNNWSFKNLPGVQQHHKKYPQIILEFFNMTFWVIPPGFQ